MTSETVVQCRHGAWVGDFWEHSAVVRELSRHLLHPRDPILAVDAKHEFFSPYSLVLGAFSRGTGLSPIAVLGAAGIVNLALLLAALPRFVRLFARHPLAPFFTLLFTLVLWGTNPLVYSGFLHFDVIGFVLPYPSTFGAAAALWCVVVWTGGRAWWRVATVSVVAAIVALTHPIAALFLVVLLVALSLREWRRLLVVAAAIVVAAAAWPYYPFFSLLRDEGVFDGSNHPLYVGVIPELLPVLPALVLLAARVYHDRRDPLALAFVGLGAFYVAGGLTSHWSLGRVLPYCVLLMDIALADWIAARFGETRAGVATAAVAGVVLIAAEAPVMHLHDPIVRALPVASSARPEAVGDLYRPLLRRVAPASVTLATAATGWPVPTFGGRIVDPLHPQAFVRDLAARRTEVELFLARSTSGTVRRHVLCRYGVSWILVRDGEADPGWFRGIATIAGRRGPYTLMRVRRPCVA